MCKNSRTVFNVLARIWRPPECASVAWRCLYRETSPARELELVTQAKQVFRDAKRDIPSDPLDSKLSQHIIKKTTNQLSRCAAAAARPAAARVSGSPPCARGTGTARR